jgi:acyl-CoA thioesterase FadM
VSDHVDIAIRWPDVDAYGHVSHMALVVVAAHSVIVAWDQEGAAKRPLTAEEIARLA